LLITRKQLQISTLKKSRRVSSLKALKSKKPIKIHLNVLGDVDHYELIKFE